LRSHYMTCPGIRTVPMEPYLRGEDGSPHTESRCRQRQVDTDSSRTAIVTDTGQVSSESLGRRHPGARPRQPLLISMMMTGTDGKRVSTRISAGSESPEDNSIRRCGNSACCRAVPRIHAREPKDPRRRRIRAGAGRERLDESASGALSEPAAGPL